MVVLVGTMGLLMHELLRIFKPM